MRLMLSIPVLCSDPGAGCCAGPGRHRAPEPAAACRAAGAPAAAGPARAPHGACAATRPWRRMSYASLAPVTDAKRVHARQELFHGNALARPAV